VGAPAAFATTTLALAEALNLPTFEAPGQQLFSRLTMILTDGRIEHAFYPTAEVLGWLRGR
jgi:hypothetical protein